VLLSIAILLVAGGLLSFLHLGRTRNAWRSVTHLKKSWLSREVLMAGLFGACWIGTAGWEWLRNSTPSYWPMAFLGIGLIYSMSWVYRLRAVPSWNTWRTQANFFLSALALGALGIELFAPLPGRARIAGLALLAELILTLTSKPAMDSLPSKARIIFLGLGILGAFIMVILPQPLGGGWIVALTFILVLAEEVIARWQFYAERVPFPMMSK
jgi:DMSO reductase anchor subunit